MVIQAINFVMLLAPFIDEASKILVLIIDKITDVPSFGGIVVVMPEIKIGRIISAMFYIENSVLIDIHTVRIILNTIPTVVTSQERQGIGTKSGKTISQVDGVHQGIELKPPNNILATVIPTPFEADGLDFGMIYNPIVELAGIVYIVAPIGILLSHALFPRVLLSFSTLGPLRAVHPMDGPPSKRLTLATLWTVPKRT